MKPEQPDNLDKGLSARSKKTEVSLVKKTKAVDNSKLLDKLDVTTLNQLRDYVQDCFKGLVFDEEAHRYKYNDYELLSTTKFIERYSAEFQAWFASEQTSKSRTAGNVDDKRTGAYYRRRWKYIADEAANQGSRVHLYAECYPYFDEPSCDKERGVLEFYKWVEDNGLSVLMLELKMFDDDYNRAGTTDGLLFDKKTKDVWMWDFKSNNANILKYNGKLLEPFKSLRDTKLNKYALQAGDYCYMFKKRTKLPVAKRLVVWLNNAVYNDKQEDVTPLYSGKYIRIFEVPDYSHIMEEETAKLGGAKGKKIYDGLKGDKTTKQKSKSLLGKMPKMKK